MSTNHNRIKVADLEINEPNKTLITNDNGELEFSDVTGGGQDLQSVLNTGNTATFDTNHSYLDLLSGNPELRVFQVNVSAPDIYQKGNFYANRYGVSMSHFHMNTLDQYTDNAHRIDERGHVFYLNNNTNGNYKIFTISDKDLLESPVLMQHTFEFPKKTTPGHHTFTLATLDDITDGVGSQDLQGVLAEGNTAIDSEININNGTEDIFLRLNKDNIFLSNYARNLTLQSNQILLSDSENTFDLGLVGREVYSTSTEVEFGGGRGSLDFSLVTTNDVKLKLPFDKTSGEYTLATLDDITGGTQDLQSVLDNGKYAEIDSGASFVEIFGGDEFDRSISLRTGNGTDYESTIELANSIVAIQGTTGTSSGWVKIKSGEAEIAQNSAGKTTFLRFTTPVADGAGAVIKIPAKQEGEYTLATLDDIPSISSLATVTYVDTKDNLKVDKVDGERLINATEITKLANLVTDLAGKQSTLISGTNLKTINGASILGSGDLTISSSQVNSDWNSSIGVSQILNKPTFKTINGNNIIGTGNITTGVISGGTQNKLTKFNSTGDNILNSNITDTGALITISSPVEINSGTANTAGLKFNNLSSVSSVTSSILGSTGVFPNSIVAGVDGNLYITNQNSKTITKLTQSGISTTFATIATTPVSIIADSYGNFYVSDNGSTVYKVTSLGVVTTFATVGAGPSHMAFDSLGNLYTANYNAGTISKITPAGVVTLVFATIAVGVMGMTIDSSDNLYTCGLTTGTVNKITSAGVATTVYASGASQQSLTIDKSNNIYVLNPNSTVTKITSSGVVTTVFATVTGTVPQKIAVDLLGNIYTVNYTNVSKITPAGLVTVLSTTGLRPSAILVDNSFNVYITNRDTTANHVAKITQATKDILTIDGLGNVIANSNISTNATGLILSPNSNTSLITNDITGKVVITKEYLNSKIGTTAPLSSTDAGTVGDIRVANGFVYWYVSGTGWLRSAGATF